MTRAIAVARQASAVHRRIGKGSEQVS